MDKYLDILKQANPVAITIIAVIAVGFFVALVTKLFSGGNRKKKVTTGNIIQNKQEEQKQTDGGNGKKKLIGIGDYKCLSFRQENGMNIARFSTMPEPKGKLFVADTSCSVNGGIYTVLEKENSSVIEDYADFSETDIKVEKTPDYAWFATHWPIVDRVFFVPKAWWQSVSVWFAAGITAGTFLFLLAVFGG